MISVHGIRIACALSDYYMDKVVFDGEDFHWFRNGDIGPLHSDNAILKAVIFGEVVTVH